MMALSQALQVRSAMSDDDMSSSEDGGVKLELDSDNEDDSVPVFEGTEAERQLMIQEDERLYHQDPTKSIHQDTNLWQLPVTPQNPKSFKYGVAREYHRTCKVLRNNWKCSPEDGMPQELQASTPYSLVMLLQLRMLSSHSKQDGDQVRALLLKHWKQRLTAAGIDAYAAISEGRRHTVETASFGSNPRSMKWVEVTIVENMYGLTLEDVANTAEVVRMVARRRKKDKNAAKKARKQALILSGNAPVKVKKPKRSNPRTAKKPEPKGLQQVVTRQPTLTLDDIHLARITGRVSDLSLQQATSGADELVAIEYGSTGTVPQPPGEHRSMMHPDRMAHIEQEAMEEDFAKLGVGEERATAKTTTHKPKLTQSEKDAMHEISAKLRAVRLRDQGGPSRSQRKALRKAAKADAQRSGSGVRVSR